VSAALVFPVVRFGFHRLSKANTPPGRKKKRELAEGHGLPLARVKPRDLGKAGVQRVPRTVGAKDGLPLLDDDRVLDVANVIWCTGFRPDFSWIDLPVLDEFGEPRHTRGVVGHEPGLYVVGLRFLQSASSGQINGVGRDADHVVRDIALRVGRAHAHNSSSTWFETAAVTAPEVNEV
jgi:putative flavoprotein involved in K+ transport